MNVKAADKFIKADYKAIHVNLKASLIAQEHYESDPKKHYATTTKSDFTKYNLVKERKLNSKVVVDASRQRNACELLSRSRSPSPNQFSSGPMFFSSCRASTTNSPESRKGWRL